MIATQAFTCRRWLPVAALLPSMIFAGCGSGASTAATTTGVGTTVAVKAPLHGLVAMGQLGFTSNPALTPDNSMPEPNANPNVYTAAVITVTWKQLQPNSGATLDTSAIEAGLNAIAAYSALYPAHKMVGKLRVFAGINTPVWALNLDGPPVSGVIDGVQTTYPRFWTANYTAAWTALQSQLAAVYDKDARLGEVAVSGCSSKSAEPFITTSDSAVIAVYRAAGYTDTQMQTCLSSMATQYAAWAGTPLDYTFNAFTHLDTGSPKADTDYPMQVATAWRTALGTARGVIATHGLQPSLTSSATLLYAQFTALGAPLEFQTISPTVDWNATIAYGLTFHPSEIEIWTTTQAGDPAVISQAQLQLWASQI